MMPTSNSTPNLVHQTWGKMRTSLSAFWSQRNRRERRLLGAALALMALALMYLVLIDPALQGRTRLQKELPTLRQQSAELQALIVKAAALAEHPAQLTALSLSKEALDASIKSKGLRAQSVVISGDIAKVQFSGVAFAALFDWLNDAQKSAHWQVIDANVSTTSGQGQATQSDSVNATITLGQQHHD